MDDLKEKIKEIWMEGFWYNRPVDYKAEWEKLYQMVQNTNEDEDEDEDYDVVVDVYVRANGDKTDED